MLGGKLKKEKGTGVGDALFSPAQPAMVRNHAERPSAGEDQGGAGKKGGKKRYSAKAYPAIWPWVCRSSNHEQTVASQTATSATESGGKKKTAAPGDHLVLRDGAHRGSLSS